MEVSGSLRPARFGRRCRFASQAELEAWGELLRNPQATRIAAFIRRTVKRSIAQKYRNCPVDLHFIATRALSLPPSLSFSRGSGKHHKQLFSKRNTEETNKRKVCSSIARLKPLNRMASTRPRSTVVVGGGSCSNQPTNNVDDSDCQLTANEFSLPDKVTQWYSRDNFSTGSIPE